MATDPVLQLAAAEPELNDEVFVEEPEGERPPLDIPPADRKLVTHPYDFIVTSLHGGSGEDCVFEIRFGLKGFITIVLLGRPQHDSSTVVRRAARALSGSRPCRLQGIGGSSDSDTSALPTYFCAEPCFLGRPRRTGRRRDWRRSETSAGSATLRGSGLDDS